jgi:hypothetical protein
MTDPLTAKANQLAPRAEVKAITRREDAARGVDALAEAILATEFELVHV